MTKIRFLIHLLLLLLITQLSPLALAINNPQIKWKVIRGANFDLIYDARDQDLANYYFGRIQRAISKTQTIFAEHPEKVLIVLNDNTDLSNGYATPYPYPHSVLFPVQPTSFESIGEYGNWEEELVIHEYTHIVSFTPQTGLMKVLRSIFGSVISPQILMPRWWLEGLAVEMETQLSQHGRLRSSYQDAIARAFVIDNQLSRVSLAEINETNIPTFPHGNRPYVFGSWMWSYLAHETGTNSIEDNLTRAHGGRLPYFIEGAAERILAKSYAQIFLESKRDLQKRVEAQLALFEGLEPTIGQDLGFAEIETWLPSLSPDGLKLALLSRDSTLKRGIKVLIKKEPQEVFAAHHEQLGVTEKESLGLKSSGPIPDGPPTGSINRLSWKPDSSGFYYDLVGENDPYSMFSDIWFYQVDSQKSLQVTKNIRAREPAISQDAQILTYVRLEPGRTSLMILDLPSQTNTVAVSPPLGVRISSPLFINSDEILFLWHEGGTGRLAKYSLSKQAHEFINQLGFSIKELGPAPSGILAISSANGINNLYWINQNMDSVKAITHTRTSVAIGSLDLANARVYAPEMTAQGWIVKSFAAVFYEPSSLPRIPSLFEDRYPRSQNLLASEASDGVTPEAEEYSGYKYLAPKFWLPTTIGSTGDRSYLAVTTSSFDPIQHHSYTLNLGYEFNYQDYYLSGNYLNQQYEWPFLVNFFNESKNATSLTTESDRWIAQVQMQKFTWNWLKDSLLQFGFEGEERISSVFVSKKQGLNISWQVNPLSYSGTMISPESGLLFKAEAKHYLTGKDHISFNQLYFLTQYHRRFAWMPRHHSWMIRAQGQWLPEAVNLSEYETTTAFNFYQNPPFPVWLFRGLIEDAVVGKSLANVNLEYRFPIMYVYRGSGLTPLFIKRLHGAAIIDGIQVDGFASENGITYRRRKTWESLWSMGLELKADVTLGYHIPVTFYWGAYQVLDQKYQRSTQPVVFGIQL